MNLRLATPSLLVDLNRIGALSGIRRDGDWLRIGAMTRQRELMESALVAQHVPLLCRALPHIGHVQTRARGTIGGSLAHADPSAELPLVMVALDAVLTVAKQGRPTDDCGSRVLRRCHGHRSRVRRIAYRDRCSRRARARIAASASWRVGTAISPS